MNSEKVVLTDNVFCPCGGETEYFGEALMGSLECKICGDYLCGVGFEFIKSINDRWIRGDRGYVEPIRK